MQIKNIIVLLLLFTLSLIQLNALAQSVNSRPDQYRKGQLIFKEDFDKGLTNWISEFAPSSTSTVSIKNGKLVIDVQGGATVWLNKKLSGNLLIEYKRKVILENGPNDRLSDLNQFWMATDPKNKNLFTRTGVFAQYDSLLLYYVGFGGNTNTTTRFRKYNGKGDRVLLTDFTDKPHLLEPNKEYLIKITVYNGLTKFYVDDVEYFSFPDKEPLPEGYFGFRTTKSRQVIDDFRIYTLQ